MNQTAATATGTATVSEKGQITIPKALRHRLNIRPGEILEMYEDRGRLVIKRQRRKDPLDEVYGILELDGPVDQLVDELRGSA